MAAEWFAPTHTSPPRPTITCSLSHRRHEPGHGAAAPLRRAPTIRRSFTEFAGTIWFAATDAEHGRELWRTDGTPAGTRLAADILPGPFSSDPLDLVATDDFLFFTAFDLEHGAEPWRVRRATPAPPNDERGDRTAAGDDRAPPVRARVHASPAITPRPSPRASISVKVKRLRTLRGRTRWHVSGSVLGTGCTGRVRIELGRGDRRLKAVTARLQQLPLRARCVATTSRKPGRWIAVRTVPTSTLAEARSRMVRVR